MLSGNTTAETQPKKSEVSLGMVYYFLWILGHQLWVITYDFFIRYKFYHIINITWLTELSYQILNQTVYELALKRNLQVHFEKIAEEGPPHLKHYSIKLVVGKQDGNDEEAER